MITQQYDFHFRKRAVLLTATYFFFPKKHIPMLFQRGGLSGTTQAATRYLFMATSKSPWVCIMLPAARMACDQWWEEMHVTMNGLSLTENEALFSLNGFKEAQFIINDYTEVDRHTL